MTDSESIRLETDLRSAGGGSETVEAVARPGAEAGSAAVPGAGTDGGDPRSRGSLRRRLGGAVVLLVLTMLFFLPWWTLFASGVDWPFPVVLAGTVVFASWLVSFPFLMAAGHGTGAVEHVRARTPRLASPDERRPQASGATRPSVNLSPGRVSSVTKR